MLPCKAGKWSEKEVPSNTCLVTIVADSHIATPHPVHGFATAIVIDLGGDDTNSSQPSAVDGTDVRLIQEP